MYRYKQRIILTAAVALAPLAVACGSEKVGSGPGGARQSVAGVHWSVDSLTLDGRTSRAPGNAYLRIGEDGRAEGNLGCNSFGSTARLTDDRVVFRRTWATEMACPGVPMAFEQKLSRTLADGALKAAVTGDRLTLTTDAGDAVHLTKERDAPLYGTKWTVTALGSHGTSVSLPKNAKPYLVLDRASGKVTGSLGCNHVWAQATVRDGHITFGRASTTRMMCDASLMRTEKSLLRLFDGTATYRLDHRTLTLTSQNGESVTAVASG
ncbi:META domain-containing protein [Streptomyces sp. NPDC046197]|uniref:META domain-containing protein n=1 Tax=Streptomyces sp. NPDC046197 TaxID=3154337 RepID=UPI0033FFFEC1